jgi:hypothetical protein
VQTYADGQAWIKGPSGVQDAPDAMRDEFRASVKRDLIPLLLRAASGEADVRPLPPAEDRGKQLAGVEVSAADLEPVGIYVDPESGLVARRTYTAPGPGGNEPVEESFSDYRDVGGLQVAFKAVIRRGGRVVIEREVTAFRPNAPVDPALFRKPT